MFTGVRKTRKRGNYTFVLLVYKKPNDVGGVLVFLSLLFFFNTLAMIIS